MTFSQYSSFKEKKRFGAFDKWGVFLNRNAFTVVIAAWCIAPYFLRLLREQYFLFCMDFPNCKILYDLLYSLLLDMTEPTNNPLIIKFLFYMHHIHFWNAKNSYFSH